MYGWVAIPGMDARDGDVGVRGFKRVDWVGGGGIECDYLSADGQVIAVRSSACFKIQLEQMDSPA